MTNSEKPPPSTRLNVFRASFSVLRRFFSALQTCFLALRGFFSKKSPVTEDDVRAALIEGEKSGAVPPLERRLAEGVFHLGDKPVRACLTHRSEIEWLTEDASAAEVKEAALTHTAQRFFPVAHETLDEVVGIVSVEAILIALLENRFASLSGIMEKPHFIPDSMTALKALLAFKNDAEYLCVMDEYGGFAGSLTIRGVLANLAPGLLNLEDEELVPLEGGAFLADGNIDIEELAEKLGMPILPEEEKEKAEFHTLAGFILSMAEEIPARGDEFRTDTCVFKITAMEGNRIDKVEIRLAGGAGGECGA